MADIMGSNPNTYGALFFEREDKGMLNILKSEANKTYTENGAVTLSTTGSDCLDFFACAGAIRRESEDEITERFMRAFTEDKDIAMKLLFFSRDVRGGLGERKVFRTILKWLANTAPDSVVKNLGIVAEYGRYDDMLVLLGTPCEAAMLELIKKQFEADMVALGIRDGVSLLAKWLPSVNTSSSDAKKSARKIAGYLGLNMASYRKALSALRAHISIIENNLREKDYSFDYSRQPSKAMFKYKKAFIRNDRDRYMSFLAAVNTGKTVLNAENVYPYELVEPYLSYNEWYKGRNFMRKISDEEKAVLNATWASMPDFGSKEDALAVVDTSGSMYGGGKPIPAAVALSLGLYFAEHNRGAYKNHFIEFSEQPQLIEIKGETFADRLRYIASFTRVANTNIEAVFDLVLNAAMKNHVSQKDLPKKLIIISDMEFDECVNNAELTNFQNAKVKYEAAGYKLPQVVFWNVASRNRQQPVTRNEQGVALVSGCTPRLFSMIAGGNLSPYTFMLEVINSKRYANIVA